MYESARKTTHLLLVDDDEFQVRLLSRIFEKHSERFRFVPVSSLAQAVAEIAARMPDIVIADLRLPDGSGTELLKGEWRDKFPIVIMTGYGDQAEAVNAMKSGAADYIVKSPQSLQDMPIAAERALREWENVRERDRAESALRESEGKYRTLVETAGEGIVTITREGRLLFLNAQAAQGLGGKPEDFIGRNIMELIPPEQLTGLLAIRDELLGAGKRTTVEFSVTLGGEEKWFRTSIQPIKDENGEFSSLLAIATDITDIKRAEKALRESELFLRSVLDGLSANIAIVNEAGEIIAVNKAWRNFVRENPPVTINVCEGADYLNVCDSAQGPDAGTAMEFAAGIRDVLAGRAARFEKEYSCHSPTEERWFIGRVTKFPGDGPPKAVIAHENITARRKAEDALAAEKERLSVTLRSIGDGVIATNLEGRIALMNGGAEDISGWKQSEAAGRPLSEVLVILNGQTREQVGDPVRLVLEAGEAIGFGENCLVIRRDGTEILISEKGAPIRDAAGKVSGVIIVFRDVTQETRMEEELDKAQRLDALGFLAGGIAHDFNNILTGILGNISLARSLAKGGDEKVLKRLQEAEKACGAAKDLTRKLLTFARGGAPRREPAFIQKAIRDAADLALRGASSGCRFNIQADLKAVNADMTQLSQVVNNLVLNAVQASETGQDIEVTAANTRLDETSGVPLPPGEYVMIEVRDHGCAIPAEIANKIFDPFFTTKDGHSGLGLTSAFSIVRRHGGHIAVESRTDEGARFSVFLPVSEDQPRDEEIPERPAGPGKGRVLVMDDDEVVLDVAGELLAECGYRSDKSRNGEEAIALYKAAMDAGLAYDAVIMDLTVRGGMGGERAVREILRLDPGARAIVASGYANAPVMAHFRQYGFVGCVSKPYMIEELTAELARVISGR
ncbi:MAG TPA: PAS domain S-box protein [Candidatus Brocadiia bacterium]|nr:PAS domain S-box protein [Candidatus Brocadiia bacterium]